MSRDDNVIPDSTYPPLEPPTEFKSQIPDHLLANASETDAYIMAQISIMRQYSDWSVKAHLSQDRQLRLTNGTVRKHTRDIEGLQGDKQFLGRGWRFLVTVAGVIGGLVSFFILVANALSGSK